ncbi:MAG TPA: TniQ family protein [Pyrinomonadaceae bacterium]|nr:TniQ family protein [Pyrinomonadaceae bacterium]
MAIGDIWSAAWLDRDIPLCEPANIESPEVPPRSWAYHIEPIGIGSSNTESLTSYFSRLAEAHCVTPRVLFRHRKIEATNEAFEESHNRAQGLVHPSLKAATLQINESGLVAEKWVQMLEDITSQKSLRFLTFLRWKFALFRSMCRVERAWCSACLENQRLEHIPICEQLCWTHRDVKVCPDHKMRLETRCQRCNSSSTVLCGSSRPGICPKCDSWLGHVSNGSGSIFQELPLNEATYEVFVAKQIGELIAIAPSLDCAPKRETPRISITNCAERFFDGNLCAFARFFGSGKGAANSLWKGNTRVTHIELLLRIAFQTSITLLDLLTKEDALADFSPLPSQSVVNSRLSPRRKKDNVLKLLLEAVEETPPPSLKEMAKRLGYRSSSTLRRYFPQICDQINANYLECTRGKEKRKFSTVRLQEDEVIKAALEAALKEEQPPSLIYIARSLGYTRYDAIRVRFPDLCRMLEEKRRIRMDERRNKIEDELKRALISDPPIPLEKVSGGLGYKTTSTLRTMYPELCHELRLRYETHKRMQLLSNIEGELRSILVESVPPPLKAALRRIGVSDGFLRKHFPKEHRFISTRYLKFRKNQSMKNKANDKNRIRKIVVDLKKRGIFPSMNAVLAVFTASYLRRPEVWDTIRQVREELSSPV